MPRVVVIGSFNMDLSVRVPRLPEPGETALGSHFQRGPGGKGSNQAIAAARLGAEVALIAAVGNDGHGRAARELHAGEGIDDTHVHTVEFDTGVALIMVDHLAENAIAVAPGANTCITAAMVEDAEETIAAADVLVGQLETPVGAFLAGAQIAHRHGTRVVLNPAPAAPVPDDLWKLIDVAIPNEHELLKLVGSSPMERAAAELRSRGDFDVVVTRGARGVLWTGADGARHLPAYLTEAVDTTGAGDAFTGGFAVGLAETGSIEAGIDLGLRAAAFSVTRHGVLDGLPDRATADKLAAG